MSRRRDIQALRAIAVLAVLAFHLDEAVVPIGFAGVDVFFVISGFVICRGIVARSDQGDGFSTRGFLWRRFNRLVPALMATVGLTLLGGVLLLPPSGLEALGVTAPLALGGISNFWFFSQTNYFNASATPNPLLHTWSLSVEEQFYLVFACIAGLTGLVGLGGRRFRATSLVIWGILGFVSLVLLFRPLDRLDQLGIVNRLELEDAAESFKFYLLPCRIYQLALGIIAACLATGRPPLLGSRAVRDIVWSALAISLLVCLFGPWTWGPVSAGLVAAFVTTGLVLVGEAPRDQDPTRHPSLTPFVWIGDRSYSIYLVHWPIIVFAEILLVPMAPIGRILVSIAATGVLGELCWRLFERRSGGRGGASTTPMPILTVYGLLVIGAASVVLLHNDGYPERMHRPPAKRSISFKPSFTRAQPHPDLLATAEPHARHVRIVPDAAESAARILVLGDSHASMLRPMAEYYASRYGHDWTIASFPGCPPVFGHYKHYDRTGAAKVKEAAARRQVEAWEAFVRDHPGEYDYVLLSCRWAWMFNHRPFGGVDLRHDLLVRAHETADQTDVERSRGNFVAGLRRTIDVIREAGAEPIIFGQATPSPQPVSEILEVPTILFGPDRLLARLDSSLFDEYASRTGFVDGVLRAPAASQLGDHHAVVLSDYFLDREERLPRRMLDGWPLMEDDNHLTKYGVLALARWWEQGPDFPLPRPSEAPDESK